jgi:hypothetical protein
MAAMASRTFAAVILKGAAPLRPRARADARPALVRSEIKVMPEAVVKESVKKSGVRCWLPSGVRRVEQLAG